MMFGERTYAPIRYDLLDQLLRVEASKDGTIEYRPCSVLLRQGELFERVYVMNRDMYVQVGGIWPDPPDVSTALAIENVDWIEDSPHRLPQEIATKIYEAGETGLGFRVFTLVLENGSRLPFSTGRQVDFLELPPGVTPWDIVDVLPHTGREFFQGKGFQPHTHAASFEWCLYEGESQGRGRGSRGHRGGGDWGDRW
jgi:hypothetical protein